jgi:hypothetical protein
MSTFIATVRAKAKELVEAIDGLSSSFSCAITISQLARDFNTLRELTLDALPSIDERWIGKPIAIRVLADGTEVCQAT